MRFTDRLKQAVSSSFTDSGRAAGYQQAPFDRVAAPTEELVAVVEPTIEMTTDAIAEAPPVETPAPTSDPMIAMYVGPDGTVDFEKLFQGVSLPTALITAERAEQILAAIPADLPIRVKRVAAKTTIDVHSNFDDQVAATASANIVADATQKLMQVARLQERLNAETAMQQAAVQAEIAALEAMLNEKRARLAAIDTRVDSAQRSCRQRSEQLNQVILFFDHLEQNGVGGATNVRREDITLSRGMAGEHLVEEEELPPFLREDSVMRMLGITAVESSLPAPEGLGEGATRYA